MEEYSGKNTGVGLPLPSPGNLANPGIKAGSPALAGGFFLLLSHLGALEGMGGNS